MSRERKRRKTLSGIRSREENLRCVPSRIRKGLASLYFALLRSIVGDRRIERLPPSFEKEKCDPTIEESRIIVPFVRSIEDKGAGGGRTLLSLPYYSKVSPDFPRQRAANLWTLLGKPGEVIAIKHRETGETPL